MSHNSGHGRPGRRLRRIRRRTLLVGAAIALVLVLAIGYGVKRIIQTRSWQITGELVSRVETDEKVVALTFDDGPTDADADTVLTALASRDVPATFYVNGQDVGPNETAMDAIIDAGHEIGNHAWHHRSLAFAAMDTVAEEIESTDAAIRETGYDAPLTFRPPHGEKLVTLPLYLADHDRLTVTWDVAYEDWSDAPQGTDDLVEATVRHTRPGSIILLHPWFGRTTTQESIGPIIDELRSRGYRFVTVSELIG